MERLAKRVTSSSNTGIFFLMLVCSATSNAYNFLEPLTSPANPVPIESPGPNSAMVLGIFENPFL